MIRHNYTLSCSSLQALDTYCRVCDQARVWECQETRGPLGSSCHHHSAHLAETKLAGKIVTTASFYPPGRDGCGDVRIFRVTLAIKYYYLNYKY